MSIPLAQRTQKIKPSATLAISAKAAQLRAQGKNIINMGAGEPDFDTPSHIKDAAIAALAAGFTKYTPVDGIPALKQVIIEKFGRDNDLQYQPAQILVSSGAKQSLYNLMQALLNPGDEVLIPAPYWVSYPDMVLLAEAKPIFINATIEHNFKITAQQLQQAITAKTRLLILNSPSNPTGMAYTHAELNQLATVLQEHPNILIASDDIYEHIQWHKPFINILNVCPALYDRTIIINGVSKAYAMTGWRIGYAAGPEVLIKTMKKVQSQSTSNACSIAQHAAQAALSGDQACVVTMLVGFKQRHDYAVAALNQIEGIECLPNHGTFYLFPDVSQLIAKLAHVNDDIELCDYLLTQAEIAAVPGTAFGAPGHIRLSIALSMQQLETAMARLQEINYKF